MKKTLNTTTKPPMEWYKWLIIIGVILGVKSYLGLLLALSGALIWLYKKGFDTPTVSKKVVITLLIGFSILLLWFATQ